MSNQNDFNEHAKEQHKVIINHVTNAEKLRNAANKIDDVVGKMRYKTLANKLTGEFTVKYNVAESEFSSVIGVEVMVGTSELKIPECTANVTVVELPFENLPVIHRAINQVFENNFELLYSLAYAVEFHSTRPQRFALKAQYRVEDCFLTITI